MILALPYLPAQPIGDVLPSMEEGFNSIVEYVNQFPYLALKLNQFMFNYIWGYWFITMGPAAVKIFNQEIRTNNYVESYHASLLRLIKPHPKCHATAHISPNRNDDRLTLSKRHCHGVREFNLNVPLLRQEITERALERTINSYTPRGIYMQAIANFPEAAENYTFVQSVERMRRLRRTFFPQTPRNMANLHDLLMAADNECFAMTLQNPPNRNVLPLSYNQLTIITDFEQGLINAVNLVFPESKHQGCYFHYCQVNSKYLPLNLLKLMRSNLFQLFKADNNAARVLRMILALPYLPAQPIGDVLPSMEEGFNSIVEYVNQFPYLALKLNQFMFNYIWGYWFITMGPAAVKIFNQEIRTNNYVESYHASLLRLIKPHPKVWEKGEKSYTLMKLVYYVVVFKCCTIKSMFNSNQSYMFVSQIRNGVPTRARIQNSNAIRNFLQELATDRSPNRVFTFLRRAGHRVDGYIAQEIGPHPGEEELLLLEAVQ
ncbi:hypothetical protein ACI65C_006885 [Semiaphis heraclei]